MSVIISFNPVFYITNLSRINMYKRDKDVEVSLVLVKQLAAPPIARSETIAVHL